MKGIIQKAALAILLVAAHSQANAQSEYREGYVISLQGDTTKGFIAVSQISPCAMKRNLSDSAASFYQPDNIQGYGYYQSRFDAKPELGEGKNNRVFMECLIKGDASLYKYNNTFYIEKSDSLFLPLYPLSSASTQSNSGDAQKVSMARNYVNTLSFLLQDCPEIREQIRQTKYYGSSLKSLIKYYNTCRSASYFEYHSGQPAKKIKWGLYSGINFNTLKMQTNDNNNDFLKSGPVYNSASAIIGADFNLTLPRGKDRFRLTFGAMYLSGSYEIDATVSNIDGTDYYHGEIKMSELKLPFGVNYVLSKRKTQPYLSTGISTSFFLKHSSEFALTFDPEYGSGYTDNYDLFNFTPIDPHLWLGAGLTVALSEKIDGVVELRYETPSNISNSSNVTTKYSHIFLLAGIRFGK
jgi:hypothetical protein